MTPEKMLELLSEHGEDAGSDYNDAEEVYGWFGWHVSRAGVLTIAYRPDDDGFEDPSLRVERAWQLVPIRLTDCSPSHTTDRRCLDCASDAEVLASLPPFPGGSS